SVTSSASAETRPISWQKPWSPTLYSPSWSRESTNTSSSSPPHHPPHTAHTHTHTHTHTQTEREREREREREQCSSGTIHHACQIHFPPKNTTKRGQKEVSILFFFCQVYAAGFHGWLP